MSFIQMIYKILNSLQVWTLRVAGVQRCLDHISMQLYGHNEILNADIQSAISVNDIFFFRFVNVRLCIFSVVSFRQKWSLQIDQLGSYVIERNFCDTKRFFGSIKFRKKKSSFCSRNERTDDGRGRRKQHVYTLLRVCQVSKIKMYT